MVLGSGVVIENGATLKVANPEFTGVDQNVAAKAVTGVTYISPSGVKSAQPQPGVNIVVTTYTDGSRAVSKQLH